MSDWSPPAEDAVTDTNIGEGINDRSMRVSPATQAARDQQAAVLRAKYDGDPAYEPQVLASIEPTVQKGAGGKSKQAVALKNAWTPPSSDAVDTPAAPTWTPPEADAAQPSLIDQAITQAKLPWQNETLGSLAKQNAFVRLYDYASKVDDLRQQIHQDNPDLGIMETASLARQQYKDKYGTAPEMSIDWDQLIPNVKKQIMENPAGFISNLVKGFVVDPELLIQPELGVASRLTGVAKTVAKAGETSATLGAGMAGVSAAEQLQKTGDVEGKPTAQAAAQGAAMGLALSAAHSALDVGLHAVGLRRGAEPTPEVETEAAQRFDAKMDDGKPAALAMAETLHEAGMDPRQASKVGASIAPINDALQNVLDSMKGEDHAVDEGQVEQGAVSEREGTGGHVQENGVDRNEPPVVQEEGNQAGGGDQLRGGEAEAPAGPGAVDPALKAWEDVAQGGRVGSRETDDLTQARQLRQLATDHDRMNREELDGLINDAQQKVDQGRLDFDTVNRALNDKSHKSLDDKIEAMHDVVDSVNAPESGTLATKRLQKQKVAAPDLEPAPVKASPENVALTKELLDQHEWSNVKKARDWLTDEQAHGDEYVRAAAEDVYQDMGASKVARSKDVNDYVGKVMELADDRRAVDNADYSKVGPLDLESGKVDPELLKVLGLTSLGVAGAAYLMRNPDDAIKKALLVGSGVAALVLFKNAARASERLSKIIGDVRYRTNAFKAYEGAVKVGDLNAYRLEAWMKGLVPDKARQEAITHAVQSGDLSGLSASERTVAEAGDKVFKQWLQTSQERNLGITTPLENYVTQFWARGINTKDSLLANLGRVLSQNRASGPGLSGKSRFGMQRVLPSYIEGMKQGYMPVTLSFPEIVRAYTSSINKTLQNANLKQSLLRERTAIGEPLLAKGADLDAEVSRRVNEQLQQEPINPAAKKMVADIAGIKAPADYVSINHPQLRDVRVHPDIAAPMQALFDATDPLAITRLAHGLSVAAKRGTFSFSLFHAASLAQAMMGMGLDAARGIPKAMSKLRGTDANVRDLVYAGLNVVDRPLEGESQSFRNALRLIESRAPAPINMPLKGVRAMQDGVDHFMWGLVFPSFKTATALAIYEKALTQPSFARMLAQKVGMSPNWRGMTPEQIAPVVARSTNVMFGGINWFDLANGVSNHYLRDLALGFASPTGRRLMQIMELAPDWTVSTIQSFLKAIPGLSTSQEGAIHRAYLARQAIVYLTVANAINQAFSNHNVWENKDPTMVDLGDGRRMQMSKHTMEPIHWLTQPAQQAWNKLSSVVKEPILQATGKEYITIHNGDIGGPPMDTSLTGRAKHVLKNLLPIPANVAAENGPGPALSGMLGAPVYGKTEQQAVDAAVERALNLKAKRDESGSTTRTQTPEQAERRVRKQYEKERDAQTAREAR